MFVDLGILRWCSACNTHSRGSWARSYISICYSIYMYIGFCFCPYCLLSTINIFNFYMMGREILYLSELSRWTYSTCESSLTTILQLVYKLAYRLLTYFELNIVNHNNYVSKLTGYCNSLSHILDDWDI